MSTLMIMLLLTGTAAVATAADVARAKKATEPITLPTGTPPDFQVPRQNVPDEYVGWPNYFSCTAPGCFPALANPAPYTPHLWEYIKSVPELSVVAKLMSIVGWTMQLEGDRAATYFLPTDAAFQSYFDQLKVDKDSLIADAGKPDSFLSNLLQYHIIPDRAFYASQFKDGEVYPTKYTSPNGHKEHPIFGSQDIQMFAHTIKFGQGGHWRCVLCDKLRYYFLDEQENAVEIFGADKFLADGSVAHIITSVLQPIDIYPSVEAALSHLSLDKLLSELKAAAAVGEKGAAVSGSMLDVIEHTSGTLVAPSNKALMNKASDATLSYHFCTQQLKYKDDFKSSAANSDGSCTTLLNDGGPHKIKFANVPKGAAAGFVGASVSFGRDLKSSAHIYMPDILTPKCVIQLVHEVMSP